MSRLNQKKVETPTEKPQIDPPEDMWRTYFEGREVAWQDRVITPIRSEIGKFFTLAWARPIPVIVESPYEGGTPQYKNNITYLRTIMRYLLQNGFAPMASHELYTHCLADTTPEERKLGIDAGFAWHTKAYAQLFFTDRGFTQGMKLGQANWQRIYSGWNGAPQFEIKLGTDGKPTLTKMDF